MILASLDTNVLLSDSTLNAKERALIRSKFMARFGTPPKLADGILVKRWATGPNKGKPKPSLTVQGMIDRGLMELPDDRGGHWLRARFGQTAGNLEDRRSRDRRRQWPRRLHDRWFGFSRLRRDGHRDEAGRCRRRTVKGGQRPSRKRCAAGAAHP